MPKIHCSWNLCCWNRHGLCEAKEIKLSAIDVEKYAEGLACERFEYEKKEEDRINASSAL